MEEGNHMVCSRNDEQVRLAASFNIYWKTVWEKNGIYSSWELQIIRSSFTTLLAMIDSCQEFLSREIWEKKLFGLGLLIEKYMCNK